MISYGKHFIDQNDIRNVSRSLKSKYITQGPNVLLFEDEIKKKFKAKAVAAVSSGTAALHLSGIALNWQPNDIILTVPLTFIATANTVLYSGAKLGFVDIDANTLNIDLNLLERKIKDLRKKGKKIKSIIAVDYAGNPCDWESIKYLSKKYNFSVINDNCHAIGSKYKNTIGYASKYADIVTHSYHAVKNITTGEGGSVLSSDKRIIEKIKNLRTHGLKYFNSNKSKLFYDMQNLGFNYRLTDFQSALGISQLKRLHQIIEERRRLLKRYRLILSNLPVKFLEIPKHVKSSVHLAIIRLDNEKPSFHKAVFKALRSKGIGVQVHYSPVHLQPYYKKFGFKNGDFMAAESYSTNAISLPIFPGLEDNQLKHVGEMLKASIENGNNYS